MIGSQTPRIKVEPPRVSSDGADAADIMAAYASTLDVWQREIVDCWLGKDAAGQYTATSAGLSVPRQNGKNVVLEARELFGLVINGERILHTAHQVRTAKKAFKRLEQIFENKRFPELHELVKNIRYTNGEECIELWNGGSIEYSARSRQAARGYDGISVVVFDEAQELTDDQVDAVTATLAASATGTRQIIYTGTPPYPTCPGTVFRRIREAALAALAGRGSLDIAWHEWSVDAENIDQIDVDNVETWYQTNPALGIRLSESYTATERNTQSKDGFARERLGWWSPVLLKAQSTKALDEKTWEAAGSDEMKPSGKTAFGVKFSADGSEVSLCGAVIPKDGPARISLIERKPTGHGLLWLVEWLAERKSTAACVVIDGRNGADTLSDRLQEYYKIKGSIVRPSARDVVAAASLLVTSLNESAVTWYRPQIQLDESAKSAEKRALAGGWAFGGPDSGPIEACALALWGAKTSKRDPTKKMRIG